MTKPNYSSPFYLALKAALDRRSTSIAQICPDNDQVARRVLHDYGAMFVGGEGVLTPPRCVFSSEQEVSDFQKAAGRAATTIGDAVIELQPAAMAALLKARELAQSEGLEISPRDGAEGARRNYADTVRLWNSRFLPALEHWSRVGRLTVEHADRLRALPVHLQV